jgi:hypothetical protein
MADSEKIFRLKLEVAEAQANANVKKLQKSLEQLDGRTKEYTLTLKKLKLERQKLNTLRSQSMESNKQLSSSMNGVSDATGGATSATLELGRAISDAPYGIRGVANNLSQLASQFSFMSNKVDATTGKVAGFSGAIRQLGVAIKANLALLLIQAGIAALDFFSDKMGRSKDGVDSLTNSIDEQAYKLNLLTESMLNAGSAMQTIDKILGTSGFAEDLKIINNEFSEFSRKYESLSELDKKDESLVSSLLEKYKQLLNIRGRITKDLKQLEELREDGTEVGRIESLESRLKLNLLIKAELEELFKVEKKVSGSSRISVFKQQLLNLEKFILDSRQREEVALEQSEADLNEIKRRYEKEDLQAKYNSFIERQKLRFQEYKERVKGAKNAAQLIAEAQKKLDESLKLAKVEYGNAINALDSAQFNERLANIRDFNEERERLALENRRKLEDIEFGEESMARQQKPFTTGKRGEAALGAQKDAQTGLEISSEAALAINSIEAELQADILSDEKKAELLLEKEQREKDFLRGAEMRSKALITLDRIELEAKKQALADGASLLNSASQLAGKSTRAGKKLAVASATISTFSATQSAFESQIIENDPTSIPRAVLAGAAALAAGLARVKQILAVKIPGGSGGGSAPSGGGRTFDFNLVGSTGQDQLAQAVGSQFNQGPIQSYVVSSQITSQQQLDNIIESDATFGGDN